MWRGSSAVMPSCLCRPSVRCLAQRTVPWAPGRPGLCARTPALEKTRKAGRPELAPSSLIMQEKVRTPKSCTRRIQTQTDVTFSSIWNSYGPFSQLGISQSVPSDMNTDQVSLTIPLTLTQLSTKISFYRHKHVLVQYHSQATNAHLKNLFFMHLICLFFYIVQVKCQSKMIYSVFLYSDCEGSGMGYCDAG